MKLYPIDKLLGSISRRYELVNLVAHRARQLAGEADEANIPLQEKPVTTALEEADAGILIHSKELEQVERIEG